MIFVYNDTTYLFHLIDHVKAFGYAHDHDWGGQSVAEFRIGWYNTDTGYTSYWKPGFGSMVWEYFFPSMMAYFS